MRGAFLHPNKTFCFILNRVKKVLNEKKKKKAALRVSVTLENELNVLFVLMRVVESVLVCISQKSERAVKFKANSTNDE